MPKSIKFSPRTREAAWILTRVRLMKLCIKVTGKQAAWACKIYRGHCCMPITLMEDMEKEGLTLNTN